MAGHTCYHCKQWVDDGEAYDLQAAPVSKTAGAPARQQPKAARKKKSNTKVARKTAATRKTRPRSR